MKGTGFSEEQIIGMLNEAEARAKTADLARRHGRVGSDDLHLEVEVWRSGGQSGSMPGCGR